MNKQKVDKQKTAMDLGFTQLVLIETYEQTLECWTLPDADLDGTFKAFDVDENEWLNVNGWVAESVSVWNGSQWEEVR